VVLLEVAKLADTPCVARSVAVLALRGLLRPSKSLIALAAHAFGVENLICMRAIGYLVSTYLGRLDL